MLARTTQLAVALAADMRVSVLLVVDRDLRIRHAEGARWARIGIDPATMRGLRLTDFLPRELHDVVLPHYHAVLAGEIRRFTATWDHDFRNAIAPIPCGDGEIAGALALAFDDGEELRAERAAKGELTRRLAQQAAVARLGELALRRASLDELMDAACRAVAEGLEVELVHVAERADAHGLMRVIAGAGWPDGFVGSEHEMRSFSDASGRQQYANGPVVIEDLPRDTRWRARPLREHGVVSSASVMLGAPHAPVGILGAHSLTRREFGAQDLDFLTAVAHVLNGAVEGLRTEERIRHDALHDALTGLPNRALLLERLSEAIARADGEGRSLALFFLDVDHLKVLNDSLGHEAGDELLRAIGPRLRAVLRPEDMIARFGGDEFAVLCEGVGDEAHALRVAERLVRAFARPFEVRGEPRFCSTSVGVVVSDPDGPRGPTELLSDADAALYRAKDRGRGRHEVFDMGLRDRTTARLRIEADLRRAIAAGDQLWVAYQPYYALPGVTVAGVEALLRWDHPELGPIPPAEFIPVAEDSGLIVDLGELVLRTACRDVARWTDLSVSVNVSARQMQLTGMPGVVGAVLRETGIEPSRLALEITEGLLLEDTAATAETLQALRRLGVRLMLDDFGTGYSSLAYLRRHPIDALKIDRAFVADLGEDGEGDAAIVQAIVGMAQALGMRVVPEGVETAGQLRRLTALGCDFAQGFHLSRPLAVRDLEALLR
ncbi:MAG TPA: EAL domain-containing protein [Solirubrobacteraceae bacterium]|nr:EAL domain-containing protein [Solirubrobacteraceae bacterium]